MNFVQSRNVKSPTTYNATNFLVGLMTNDPHKVNVMKKDLCEDPPEYILIGNS